ncbi:hypothetical protein EMIT051CA3_20167 [Pseudomonas chlororaphis]
MQSWCRRSSSSVERLRKSVAGIDAQQLQWPDSRALHAAALCRDLVDGPHLESQKKSDAGRHRIFIACPHRSVNRLDCWSIRHVCRMFP